MYSTGRKYEFIHSHSISLSFIYSFLRICTVIKWQLGGLQYDFDTDKLSWWFQSVWEELSICFSPKHWQDCTTTMEVWRSRSLSSPHWGQKSLMGCQHSDSEQQDERQKCLGDEGEQMCQISQLIATFPPGYQKQHPLEDWCSEARPTQDCVHANTNSKHQMALRGSVRTRGHEKPVRLCAIQLYTGWMFLIGLLYSPLHPHSMVLFS